MKNLLYLALFATLISCEEKDITDENPAPPDINTVMVTSFIYGTEGIHTDSVLTNDLGYSFFITDVQIVVNKFFFVEGADTVSERTEPFILTMTETDELLVKMEPRGYSGFYGVQFGFDSIASLFSSPLTLEAGNELINSDVFRNPGDGIDHFVLKGRLIDPTDPLDSVGQIPFEYRLGTYQNTRIEASLNQNFSLTRNSKVKFVLQFDLEPILKGLDIFATPMITSDVTNPVDFNLSNVMSQGIEIGLF